MGNCDLCGKRDELVNAYIEGTLLSVCGNCSKFGKVIPQNKKKEDVKIKKVKRTEGPVENIVGDCASLIKNAREKRNLKQEDVAKAINEKLSLIQKIESGGIKPSIELATKIGKFFDIRLVEITENKDEGVKKTENSGLTIGDLINIKNEQK